MAKASQKKSSKPKGRPKLSDADSRGTIVSVRLTKAEVDALRARATELGLSLSNYLRLLGRKDAGLPSI